MPRVHILSPDLIAKIAAGEVIERPASVVKELLENSLDAEADTIDIQLSDAGKTQITLKDNGHGIEPDDLEQIFHRHATSKIQTAEDLFNIMSMGFRGEALYSIAAISDIVLRTMTKDSDSGMEIHLRGGKKLDVRPCALSGPGTEIEVKELFFNTPARRKFLKSNTTEMNQILNIFTPYTLLCPDRRFRLKHQNKDLMNLPPTTNYLDRAAQVLHLDQKHLLESRKDLMGSNNSIHLVLGDMNIQRSRRDMQFIFVNNRPVQNKNIGFHMNQIYKLIMPEKHYPFFAVFINIPPDEVDVNIHPAKREVKIKDEQGLCRVLRTLTEQTLMTRGKGMQVNEVGTEGRSQSTEDREAPEWQQPGSAEIISVRQERHDVKAETFLMKETVKPQQDGQQARNTSAPQTQQYAFSPAKPQDFYVPEESPSPTKQDNLQSQLEEARYIGAFMNKYLLFESGSSLLMIDQHAAAERVTFEQLIRQMKKKTLEVQPLLSPDLITLTVQQMLSWEEVKDKLKTFGFDTSAFDEQTLAIHSYPALIKNPSLAVENILYGEDVADCDPETLARRACRGSVMSGDRMDPREVDALRKQLIQCFDPFTCPHGRPTVVEIKEDFLAKNFFRK